MRTKPKVRIQVTILAAALCLSGYTLNAAAQSTPPAPPASPQDDNPFPGTPEKPAQPSSTQPSQAEPSQAHPKPAQPAPDNDNPFPGATGIPTDTIPPSGASDASTKRGIDPDRDPVPSPDAASATPSDDGFSSSRSGLTHAVAEDDVDARPGKSLKSKTREQIIQEDLDIGKFYLDRKNWKGAQSRFTAAYALDPENPGAVWGLAETERHLNLYKEAEEHFLLFLSYDPDGPHSREARKALDQLESMPKSAATTGTVPAVNTIAPK